jgi:hypothetical protein
MITALLILHGLIAVALLGAVTHQAVSVARGRPGSRQTFVGKFGGVAAHSYSNAIILLFVLSIVAGALLYPDYRLDVRPTLEDLDLRAANGVFEIKEHLAAIGLGLLPAYWFFWKQPLTPENAGTRKYLAWILAFIVWWNFLVGHVLNNIKGIFES